MLKTVSSVINAIGALNYKGTWNASTNTPTLTSSVGTKGDYYVVSVAGNTNLNGETLWGVGDWAVFNGSVWQKVDGGSTGDFTNITVNGTANIATANVTNFSSGNVAITGGSLANVTISNGTVDGANPYLNFSNGASVTVAAGRLWYNGETGSWNAGMGGGAVTQQIGEEIYVYGKASATISGETILQAVYKTGTVGASSVIQFAPTVAGITDLGAIIGVATENIATNGFGRITNFGVVRGINTSGSTYGETWADGDDIWYNPVTGGLTKTKPVAPNIKIQIGTIINAGSGGSGSFQVLLSPGSTLGGTDSNVQISSSPTNNSFLTYNSASTIWTDSSPSTARTALGLGTMATQNSNNVTITGGSINVSNTNTVATTANTATFATAALPLEPEGYITINVNGIAKKVPYYGV